MLNEEQWRNSLQVGDLVALESGFGNKAYALARVSRTTNTQIVVGKDRSERRYNKRSGQEVGGGAYGTSITKPTDHIVQTVKKGRLVTQLDNFNWKQLSVEQLEQITKLLPKIDPNLVQQ